MGTTVRVWQLDGHRGAEVHQDLPETRRALIADGTRELDLDQSWAGIERIFGLAGLESPFETDELPPAEVRHAARVLKPLPWAQVLKLCEMMGDRVDAPDYIGPHYDRFRDMILEAAEAGRALAFEIV